MTASYSDSESRYRALKTRDPKAEGKFVYAVISTSIVCRPTCSSRLALAKNIIFYDTVQQAIQQGFRPCKRCRPEVLSGWNNTRNGVAQACCIINQWVQKGERLDVDSLAKQVGFSKWHFCRVFKNYTDYTPRQFYLLSCQGLCPVKKLPLIRTKRFLARARNMDLRDQIAAEILQFCDKDTETDQNGFSGLEPSDLDLLELDWYSLLNQTPLEPGSS